MNQGFIIELTIGIREPKKLIKGYYAGDMYVNKDEKFAFVSNSLNEAIVIQDEKAIVKKLIELTKYKNVATVRAKSLTEVNRWAKKTSSNQVAKY